jgi:hypothetical protein
VSSPSQATTSYLLAQVEDPILHVARDRVGFNKDHCRCVQIKEKYLPSSYFIIFSLPNIYMQIRPGGMVIDNATTNVASVTSSSA